MDSTEFASIHDNSASQAARGAWQPTLPKLDASRVLAASDAMLAVGSFASVCTLLFASDPLAQRQPLYGAFFLVAPALVGTAWSLSVQYATARALAAWKARRRKHAGPEAPAPEPTVKVSVVDPAVAICVVQAIEGAAYVDDPLSYLIETLTAGLERILNERMLSVDQRQVAQVSRIQRVFRAHIAMRRMRTMV